MRVTYDGEANAAYVYLQDKISPGAVKRSYVCNHDGLDGEIILDVDENNRLIGIEVLHASNRMPSPLLEGAERIG